jgi:hypothetical protein
MVLYVGNNSTEPSEIWYGSNKVKEVYWGNKLVWPSPFKRFVAFTGTDAAQYNRYIFSDDGINWQSNSIKVIGDITGVAYGNGKFVAVGYNSAVLYSYNGIKWYEGTTSSSINLDEVAYGNGKFVAVGSNGGIAYSLDGISWTVKSSLIAILNCIAYGNNIFVASGSYQSNADLDRDVIYSVDGINWTAVKLTGADTGSSLTGLAYGAGKFVGFNANGFVSCSSDGINWNATGKISGNSQDITYGNGKFVAVGRRASVAYSTDGITWNSITIENETDDIRRVAYGNGKFVTVGYYSGTSFYSTNGINWNKSNISNEVWRDIAYGESA